MLSGCSNSDTTSQEEIAMVVNEELSASIVSVSYSGTTGNYTLAVGISSPDTGCAQYANWWEVITEDGTTLIYRRILAHSHVSEQPFVRSGGAVSILKDQVVLIRVHMNTSGYGTAVFKGSVSNGFTALTVASDFANTLATQEPLPSSCAF